MRNVTITLDEDLARWARVEAAKRDVSLSALVRELLQERRRTGREYERAMKGYLADKPRRLSKPGDSYPMRDELHDRAGLR